MSRGHFIGSEELELLVAQMLETSCGQIRIDVVGCSPSEGPEYAVSFQQESAPRLADDQAQSPS